ncbi:Creatinase aminopeptidase [Coniophora puteana RWD-64-598 SS2]|uniref:Creatinase aminopeptidase n=1 Tax=Coniophora puteana (strain RWD-64-598) TaxID=741705 RepID=A0A5M3MWJ7_CONPW|nr:Creatinase aminopeptidase [Coniophora puteana RWD-64-598 SS2]EIW83367.1 Creatinase aminopeptidase [Coniophora puteana RWD-64-598 SS2]
MAPPPPPPPPLCLPFTKRNKRIDAAELTRSFSQRSNISSRSQGMDSYRSADSRVSGRSAGTHQPAQLVRTGSYSPTQTLASDAEKLSFDSDSEVYDVPALPNKKTRGGQQETALVRSDSKRKWGYGWGMGKNKEGRVMTRERSASLDEKPSLHTSATVTRSSTRSSGRSGASGASGATGVSGVSGGSRRPPYYASDSSSTLVGSAYIRKEDGVDDPIQRRVDKEKVDTAARLEEIRKLMMRDNLDYYVIPSEDAHQSEYVAKGDKRREWISGFTGSAGQAIISKSTAYLVTDSRYWIQAKEELDNNWHLIPAGDVDGPKDWIDWLSDRAKDARIGMDARMISHQHATQLTAKINEKKSKLVFPPQNYIDLVWKDKPSRSKEPVFIQPIEFTGREASSKLAEIRNFVRAQPPSVPSYSKSNPTPAQMHVGTLITSLSSIAYLLNLRGSDIPYNPLFYAYLFVSLDRITLFLDASKLTPDVEDYLASLGIERKEYNDIWAFLRRREWGEGKIIIHAETSYAISLMLTHFRYTVAPSFVEDMKAVKNEVELEGMRRAYIRDGAAYVKWLAWLEHKIQQGYDITEWEAAWRLTEYRRQNKHYWGLAYENISASGPNAALPHYSPTKLGAKMIDRETPYLNDSGGQYRDGTCDTTRTVHFGRPTQDQCEAYTRVLQGHIGIDSAVFPEGTKGSALDVLARRALWKDGLNYLHGTGHGVGAFLNVHEGPHGFSNAIPLVPGHVITNEPGFYLEGRWGMRIESALVVRRVKTKGEFNGDIWLGFERLTCVPIQTRMVKENMLTKEEKQWLKDHNKKCLEKLEPYLKDDKRALKWLKREADRGFGLAAPGPGGIAIDWD